MEGVVCMYICSEVALLCGVPIERGVQLGLGKGPIKSGSPMSQPRGYHRSRVTHTGSYLANVCAFCNQLDSGQLRVIILFTLAGRIFYQKWHKRSEIFCPTIVELNGESKKLQNLTKYWHFRPKCQLLDHCRSKNQKLRFVSQLLRQFGLK